MVTCVTFGWRVFKPFTYCVTQQKHQAGREFNPRGWISIRGTCHLQRRSDVDMFIGWVEAIRGKKQGSKQVKDFMRLLEEKKIFSVRGSAVSKTNGTCAAVRKKERRLRTCKLLIIHQDKRDNHQDNFLISQAKFLSFSNWCWRNIKI